MNTSYFTVLIVDRTKVEFKVMSWKQTLKDEEIVFIQFYCTIPCF